jgi:hypothetical protein
MIRDLTIDAVKAIIATGEAMLNSPVVQTGPIGLVIRTALIRQMVAADQLLANLTDGATLVDCRDLFDCVKVNHKIIVAACNQLRG